MKKVYLLFTFLLVCGTGFSQDELSKEEKERREKNIEAGNPFARFGYKAKVATLSKGKYLEFHDLDSIVTIGSVRFNVYNKQIVGNIVQDTLNLDAQPIGDVTGRWISPDPLSEEFPSWSPYAMSYNNPIKYVDPDGRAPKSFDDDYVFDENGKFVRIDKNNQPDKIVVENSKTGFKQNYWFADPVNDPKDIKNGIINQLVRVSKNKIESMLNKQGAFAPENKNNISLFYKQSKGGGDFDYSYSVIPKEFAMDGVKGVSFNPLKFPSTVLFLPEGDYMAHNHMNFGNYLWAATGYTLGFDYSTLQLGAHVNSLKNSPSNGYPSQLDSKDDQESIVKGAYYSSKNNFRQKVDDNIEKAKNKGKR